MAKATTPTTELEAVNILLSIIGEAPINTLTGELVTDAVIARDILGEISRDIQTEGYSFNTEYRYPLVRTINGEIILPQNIAQIDIEPENAGSTDPVQRGNRLYDRQNHTYKFDQTLYATIVFLLPFEELPEVARRLITIRAGRVYQNRTVGSDTLDGFQNIDEARARALFYSSEAAVADYNILNTRQGSHQQTVRVGQVLRR